jgi:hypothetical protein
MVLVTAGVDALRPNLCNAFRMSICPITGCNKTKKTKEFEPPKKIQNIQTNRFSSFKYDEAGSRSPVVSQTNPKTSHLRVCHSEFNNVSRRLHQSKPKMCSKLRKVRLGARSFPYTCPFMTASLLENVGESAPKHNRE